eukprot:3329516-Alexandrium_andersonii.AAC.1
MRGCGRDLERVATGLAGRCQGIARGSKEGRAVVAERGHSSIACGAGQWREGLAIGVASGGGRRRSKG